MHAKTAVAISSCPDAAAVGVDDGTADGEPHSQSLGFGGDEALEDTLQLGGSYADASVRDLDDYAAGLGLARKDRDYARAVLAGADGLTRIHQDVQQHLLELHRVAADCGHRFHRHAPDVD